MRERRDRGWLVLACVRLCESAMHARERRNVSDIASLALLVDIYGRGVEGFNCDPKLCRRCHRKPAATAKMKENLAVRMR